MEKLRPWLRDIALWFDGFRNNRRARAIIRKRLIRLGKASRRRARSRRFAEDFFPLSRVMNLSEQYELVAAIHDGICEDTWKVSGLFPGGWENRGADYAGIRIIKWAGRLAQVTDGHFNQVRDAVERVAKDLGVDPPRLTPPIRTIRKIIHTRETLLEGKEPIASMSSRSSLHCSATTRRRLEKLDAELASYLDKLEELESRGLVEERLTDILNAHRWTLDAVAIENGPALADYLQSVLEKSCLPARRTGQRQSLGSMFVLDTAVSRARNMIKGLIHRSGAEFPAATEQSIVTRKTTRNRGRKPRNTDRLDKVVKKIIADGEVTEGCVPVKKLMELDKYKNLIPNGTNPEKLRSRLRRALQS